MLLETVGSESLFLSRFALDNQVILAFESRYSNGAALNFARLHNSMLIL